MSCSDVDIGVSSPKYSLIKDAYKIQTRQSFFTSQMAAIVGSSDEYNYEQ